MKTSDSIGKFAEAFAAAQREFTHPSKNRTVKVKTKAGPEYTFDYATFDEILRCTVPHLGKAGISFTQCVDNNGTGDVVTTRLMHASGEWIESETPIFISGEGAQAFGSGITYSKRYALSAMLGVAAEEDDDGNAADGNRAKYQDRRPAATQPPKQPPTDSPQWLGFMASLEELLKLSPEVWPSMDSVRTAVKEAATAHKINPAGLRTATAAELNTVLQSVKAVGNRKLEALQKAKPADSQEPPQGEFSEFAGTL